MQSGHAVAWTLALEDKENGREKEEEEEEEEENQCLDPAWDADTERYKMALLKCKEPLNHDSWQLIVWHCVGS